MRIVRIFSKRSDQRTLTLLPQSGFYGMQLNDGKLDVINSSGKTQGVAMSPLTAGTPVQAIMGYILPLDTRVNDIVINPPTFPQVGDFFSVVDARDNVSLHSFTVDFVSSSQKYFGSNVNYSTTANTQFITFYYVNNVVGWVSQSTF